MVIAQLGINENCVLTHHAEQRAAQRGIRKWLIEMMIKEGDSVQHVGAGCVAITASRARIQELTADGAPTTALAAMEKLAVVLGPDDQVVTTLWLNRSRRGRSYRRGRR